MGKHRFGEKSRLDPICGYCMKVVPEREIRAHQDDPDHPRACTKITAEQRAANAAIQRMRETAEFKERRIKSAREGLARREAMVRRRGDES